MKFTGYPGGLRWSHINLKFTGLTQPRIWVNSKALIGILIQTVLHELCYMNANA